MNPAPLFCSGLELGRLVVSSGLLHSSCRKISEIYRSIDPTNQTSDLIIREYPEAEARYNVVAFVATPDCTKRYLFREGGSVNSALSSVGNQFDFLSSGNISSFSVHSPAYQLFASAYDRLSRLKSKLLKSEKPVIITGSALGGSVASLFTLWLLDTIEPGRKRPLCITFGSPLIADASLQQVLENSTRNSCFIHVASNHDPFPKLLISSNSFFKPFGTFLLCFELECFCIEDPDAVLMLLSINGVAGQDLVDRWNVCEETLHRLERSSVLMEAPSPGERIFNGLLAVISLTDSQINLTAQEHVHPLDHQDAIVIRDVIIEMEECSMRKPRFNPFKKLNDMKILLAHLEWYKKTCKDRKIGYYDHFKTYHSQIIIDVEKWKRELNEFWKSVAEAAKKKPQSERAAFRKRFLYASNNYRRLVEPLDIAEHYRNNNSSGDYRETKRSRHYVMIERWFDEAEKPKKVSPKQDLTNLLTMDSCFWARVEEALILIELLSNGGIRDGEREGKLGELERYVWEMIGKRTVSPEIFLEKSSFMLWWSKYRVFRGDGYRSPFTDFMNSGEYIDYGKPVLT